MREGETNLLALFNYVSSLFDIHTRMMLHLRRCFKTCCFLKCLVIWEGKSSVFFFFFFMSCFKKCRFGGVRILLMYFSLENYCDSLSISSQNINASHIFPHLSVGAKELEMWDHNNIERSH